MNRFTRLCRNLGLLIHDLRHHPSSTIHTVAQNTRQTSHANITLRRTTIDEIEIHPPHQSTPKP